MKTYPGRGEKRYVLVVIDRWQVGTDEKPVEERFSYRERDLAVIAEWTFTRTVELRERYSTRIEEVTP